MIRPERFEKWWVLEGLSMMKTKTAKEISEIAWANGHYIATIERHPAPAQEPTPEAQAQTETPRTDEFRCPCHSGFPTNSRGLTLIESHDQLERELAQRTKERDECERQFQNKQNELIAITAMLDDAQRQQQQFFREARDAEQQLAAATEALEDAKDLPRQWREEADTPSVLEGNDEYESGYNVGMRSAANQLEQALAATGNVKGMATQPAREKLESTTD